MRFPQLLIYETDGRLARMLEGTAGTHRYAMRQPRQVESCLRLMRRGGPAIVIVRLENDLERAFILLEQTMRLFPDVATVVVVDSESAVLVDLAWDLGVRYVLSPSQPSDLLLDVAAGLMADGSANHESA